MLQRKIAVHYFIQKIIVLKLIMKIHHLQIQKFLDINNASYYNAGRQWDYWRHLFGLILSIHLNIMYPLIEEFTKNDLKKIFRSPPQMPTYSRKKAFTTSAQMTPNSISYFSFYITCLMFNIRKSFIKQWK